MRIVVTDDLERPRLTVLFRLLLAIPHFVWLLLWSVAAVLRRGRGVVRRARDGRVPSALHRFLAAYIRYVTHLFAFVHVVGRRFPGFTGRAGSYGVDLEIDPPERQNRWKTLFRFFLAIPALHPRERARRGRSSSSACSAGGTRSARDACLKVFATSGVAVSVTAPSRTRTSSS